MSVAKDKVLPELEIEAQYVSHKDLPLRNSELWVRNLKKPMVATVTAPNNDSLWQLLPVNYK